VNQPAVSSCTAQLCKCRARSTQVHKHKAATNNIGEHELLVPQWHKGKSKSKLRRDVSGDFFQSNKLNTV